MRREYELVLIVDTQLEEAEVDARIAKFQDVLTNGGAEIAKMERWGSRRLAYEIRKRQQGFYVLIYFRAEGELIPELERELRLDAGILRYLVVLSEDVPAEAEKQEAGQKAEPERARKTKQETGQKAEPERARETKQETEAVEEPAAVEEE